MKILKLFLMTGVLGAALLGSAPSSAALITLSQAGAARVGSAFSVDVIVDNAFAGLSSAEQLLAFGLTVAQGSSGLFSFTGASILAPFDDDSRLVGLDAAGSAFPGISNTPANQSLRLATLTFLALAAGNGVLGIRSDLGDPNQGLIFLEQGPVNLNADLAVDVAPVPLPAALPLFLAGAGLLGAAGRKRRRFS